MTHDSGSLKPRKSATTDPASVSRDIAWYHPGESRLVDIGGLQITVRLVERNGRRARIAITAPAGAVFRDVDLGEIVRSSESFS